jgi:hypothetical protein
MTKDAAEDRDHRLLEGDTSILTASADTNGSAPTTDRIYIRPTENGLMLASLTRDSFTYSRGGESIETNAHLIAAAPDLLETLNDLWQWASEQRTHLTTDPVPDGLGARVLAAIAKAEGRS